MSMPGAFPIVVPDEKGSARIAWRVVGLTSAGLALVVVLAIVALLFPAILAGDIRPIMAAVTVAGVLLIVTIVAFIVNATQQTDLNRRVSDALTLAGHPGVEVSRLLRGQRVASPTGRWLALRRERNDAGRWLLIDAVG